MGIYLSEHFWVVVDIGGATGLSLESLQLQVIFGHIGSGHQQAMQWTSLGAVRLKHDL